MVGGVSSARPSRPAHGIRVYLAAMRSLALPASVREGRIAAGLDRRRRRSAQAVLPTGPVGSGGDRRPRRSARAWIPTGPGDAGLAEISLGRGRASSDQRQLRRNGLAGWQVATTAGLLAAIELSARPSTFLDIGANAGVYSLLCKRLFPEMDVIAFEPVRATRKAGQRWASANEVQIQFEAIALSDHVGSAPMYVSAKGDASNSLVKGFREASETVTVDVLTLDAYLERTGVMPSVLKIDVEQHEPAVIRGAARALERYTPIIVIEMLKRHGELTDAAREAHLLLEPLGYEARPLEYRDWLYWHGGVPAEFDNRSSAWRVAIERCVPFTE